MRLQRYKKLPIPPNLFFNSHLTAKHSHPPTNTLRKYSRVLLDYYLTTT